MPMHASSLVVFMSLCGLAPHTTPTWVSLRSNTCMNDFVLVVFSSGTSSNVLANTVEQH